MGKKLQWFYVASIWLQFMMIIFLTQCLIKETSKYVAADRGYGHCMSVLNTTIGLLSKKKKWKSAYDIKADGVKFERY